MRLKKFLITGLALLFSSCCIIGSVFAALTAKTDKDVNTFVIGDINISLFESDDLKFDLSPNTTLKKDPKITVEANSVDCYLYVKVEESATLDKFIDYEVSNEWTPLKGLYPNIYYREVNKSNTDKTYSILENDSITTTDFTVDDVKNNTVKPSISFIGYAVQKEEVESPETGWELLTKQYNF